MRAIIDLHNTVRRTRRFWMEGTLHDLSRAVADRRARDCLAPSFPSMYAHWYSVLVRLL